MGHGVSKEVVEVIEADDGCQRYKVSGLCPQQSRFANWLIERPLTSRLNSDRAAIA